jgi:hypothetical protein
MRREIAKRIAALEDMTVPELREEYARVFGEETRSKHKVYLRKRITWGLQAREYGGLSDRALRRAEELANESDLTLLAPKGWTESRMFQPRQTGPQLLPGSQLTREYKGKQVLVTVLPGGFEWQGKTYKTISAVAKAITGSHCSGNWFFGLTKRRRA